MSLAKCGSFAASGVERTYPNTNTVACVHAYSLFTESNATNESPNDFTPNLKRIMFDPREDNNNRMWT